MGEIESKVSELGARITYLEQKAHEGNGWTEYKNLVLANQVEAKESTKLLIEKVSDLETRIKSVEEITNRLDEHDDDYVSKESFTKIQKMVYGDNDNPGMLEISRFFKKATKLYWTIIGAIILLLVKEYILGFLMAIKDATGN